MYVDHRYVEKNNKYIHCLVRSSIIYSMQTTANYYSSGILGIRAFVFVKFFGEEQLKTFPEKDLLATEERGDLCYGHASQHILHIMCTINWPLVYDDILMKYSDIPNGRTDGRAAHLSILASFSIFGMFYNLISTSSFDQPGDHQRCVDRSSDFVMVAAK